MLDIDAYVNYLTSLGRKVPVHTMAAINGALAEQEMEGLR